MNERVEIKNPGKSDSLPSVRWDDSNLRSQYSNVCNVTGTREEIILLFGVHQAWRPDVKELTVQLQERIILNPHAAKRMNMLLGRVIQAYERKYGALQTDLATPGAAPETLQPD